MISSIVESIDIDVPVREAYNVWTRFEDFPAFMQGVERVEQLDDRRLRWTVDHFGHEHSWVAEITEQEPDQRIAWRDLEGKGEAGVVTFHRLGANRCRVTLQMEWEPEGFVEGVGEKLGFDRRMATENLKRFRQRTKDIAVSPHGWRGTIERDPG